MKPAIEKSSEEGLSPGTYIWLGVFALAMGFLEAVVVVYLRELYYPNGFGFPLGEMPQRILFTEMLREASTIFVLAAVAIVAARNNYLRLSYFLYIFGIWDIIYYVVLKLLLGWPKTITAWDILFLIPVAWTAPVLAPVTSAVTMLALSAAIACLVRTGDDVRVAPAAWALVGAGALAIFVTFVWDYSSLIVQGGFLVDLPGLPDNAEFKAAAGSYVPTRYNWHLFVLGELMILVAVAVMWKTARGGRR